MKGTLFALHCNISASIPGTFLKCHI